MPFPQRNTYFRILTAFVVLATILLYFHLNIQSVNRYFLQKPPDCACEKLHAENSVIKTNLKSNDQVHLNTPKAPSHNQVQLNTPKAPSHNQVQLNTPKAPQSSNTLHFDKSKKDSDEFNSEKQASEAKPSIVPDISFVNYPDLSANFSFPDVNESYIKTHLMSRRGRLKISNPADYLFDIQDAAANKTYKEKLMSYLPAMITKDEHLILIYLFQQVIRACLESGTTFMLRGGTLLGSYRHHDMIPWDDDIDIWVNGTAKEKLKEALLQNSQEMFDVYNDKYNTMWKFYWKNSNYLPHKKYRYPWVDLFFWHEKDGFIADDSKGWRKIYNYKKKDVFPLTLRPFHGALLPVPCKTAKLLKFMKPDTCKIHTKIHKMAAPMPRDIISKPVPCTSFYKLFSFVRQRWSTGTHVFEEQVGKDQHARSIAFSAKCDWDGGNEPGDRRMKKNQLRDKKL